MWRCDHVWTLPEIQVTYIDLVMWPALKHYGKRCTQTWPHVRPMSSSLIEIVEFHLQPLWDCKINSHYLLQYEKNTACLIVFNFLRVWDVVLSYQWFCRIYTITDTTQTGLSWYVMLFKLANYQVCEAEYRHFYFLLISRRLQ